MERFDPPMPLTHFYWPNAPQVLEQDLIAFNLADEAAALRLAEQLCGRSIPQGTSTAERRWSLLAENALIHLLEEHLTIPRSLDELVAYLQQQPERRGVAEPALAREITAYLLLGSLAIGTQGPRLRPMTWMAQDLNPFHHPHFPHLQNLLRRASCNFRSDVLYCLHEQST